MFAAKVTEALKAKGMSAYKLAQATGQSESHVYNVLHGRREATAEIVDRWAPVLDLDPEEMKALADADRLGPDGVERILRFFGRPAAPAAIQAPTDLDTLTGGAAPLTPAEKKLVRQLLLLTNNDLQDIDLGPMSSAWTRKNRLAILKERVTLLGDEPAERQA